MMKFLSLAVAALVSMTEAKKTISAQQLKTRMAKGQFNKETLMRGAKPYGETARRLEEAGAEEQAWEINGLYSVQFSRCVSMTVQDEDLFSENYIDYAQNGDIVAEKSYIVFTACKSADCYYQADDEQLTFLTDIASFFQAFADFLPNQVENYCEGCNQNYDYCMGNLDAQQADDGAAGDDGAAAEEAQDEAEQQDQAEAEGQQEGEEGQQEGEEGQQEGEEGQQEGEGEEGQQEGEEGQQEGDQQGEGEQEGQQQEGEGEGENNNEGQRRKLSKIFDLPSRRLANNQVVTMIDCDMCAAYECYEEEGGQQQGDDGAVVYEFEDALNWLDGLSQCQQMDNGYNDMVMYASLICNADGNGVEIGVFFDQECTLYAPKLSYGNMMSDADKEYFSMSEEIVEYMFTNDFSCYQPEIQYTNPYQYQEQQAEDDAGNDDAYPGAAEWCNNLYNGNMEAISMYDCGADANAEQNDDQNQEYDENLDNYGWYSYQLSQQDAEDGSAVCKVIKGFNGEKNTVYDKTNGGSLYNYKKNWGNKNERNGMRPGGVAALVIFIILFAAGFAAFIVKKKKANDKRTPLISSNEGTMA